MNKKTHFIKERILQSSYGFGSDNSIFFLFKITFQIHHSESALEATKTNLITWAVIPEAQPVQLTSRATDRASPPPPSPIHPDPPHPPDSPPLPFQTLLNSLIHLDHRQVSIQVLSDLHPTPTHQALPGGILAPLPIPRVTSAQEACRLKNKSHPRFRNLRPWTISGSETSRPPAATETYPDPVETVSFRIHPVCLTRFSLCFRSPLRARLPHRPLRTILTS